MSVSFQKPTFKHSFTNFNILDMQSIILLREASITNLKNKYPENWKNEFYKLVKLYEKDTIGNPIEMYRKIYNDTVKLNP